MAKLNIDVGVNGSQATTQLKQIERNIDQLGRSANKLGQAFNISGLNRFTEALSGIGMGPVGWIGLAAGGLTALVKNFIDANNEQKKFNDEIKNLSLVVGASTLELTSYTDELNKVGVSSENASKGITSLTDKYNKFITNVQDGKDNLGKAALEKLGIDPSDIKENRFLNLRNVQLAISKQPEHLKNQYIKAIFGDLTEDQQKIVTTVPQTGKEYFRRQINRPTGAGGSYYGQMDPDNMQDRLRKNEIATNYVDSAYKALSSVALGNELIISSLKKDIIDASKKELNIQEKINELIIKRDALQNKTDKNTVDEINLLKIEKELIPLKQKQAEFEKQRKEETDKAEQNIKDTDSKKNDLATQLIDKAKQLSDAEAKTIAENDPTEKHKNKIDELRIKNELTALQVQSQKEQEALDKRIKADQKAGMKDIIKDRKEIALKGVAGFAAGTNLSMVSRPIQDTNEILKNIEKNTREANN